MVAAVMVVVEADTVEEEAMAAVEEEAMVEVGDMAAVEVEETA